MGWERKRGKLHELDLLLRGDSDTTFLPLGVPLPENVRPCDDPRCRHAHHPRCGGKPDRQALPSAVNRPHFDAAKRVVTAGYAILQPRITASLTSGDEASFFQRVSRPIEVWTPMSSPCPISIRTSSATAPSPARASHVDAFEAALKKGRIEEKHDPQPRSARRRPGALRARHRCRTGRGLSDPLLRRRLSSSSLGARRLAVAGLHPRSALRRTGIVALEDARQPAPLADADLLGAGGDSRLDLLPFTQARAVAGPVILSLFMARHSTSSTPSCPRAATRRRGDIFPRWRATLPSAPPWWR